MSYSIVIVQFHIPSKDVTSIKHIHLNNDTYIYHYVNNNAHIYEEFNKNTYITTLIIMRIFMKNLIRIHISLR